MRKELPYYSAINVATNTGASGVRQRIFLNSRMEGKISGSTMSEQPIDKQKNDDSSKTASTKFVGTITCDQASE